MKKRDMAIIQDLERFRCMTRDDIIDLHFSNLKTPVTSCNTVLKRLRRDGHIEVNAQQQPYIYFPCPAGIKKDSAKIPHFLKIVEFYKSLLPFEQPSCFAVEPKYGKGYMEPDAFMIWKRGPFFVEIQRSTYSQRVMAEKVSRYEAYFHSREWQQETWQPSDKCVFPTVLILTDTRYPIESSLIRFIQIQNIDQLLNRMKADRQEIRVNGGTLKLVT